MAQGGGGTLLTSGKAASAADTEPVKALGLERETPLEPQAAGYSSLVRFMAVVGGALERSRWERAAYTAGLRTDSGNSLTPAQIAGLMDAALACGHIEQGRHGLQCAPSHAFAAFREVALGERDLREWRSAVLALFDGRPELSAVRGPSFERLVAIMRFAMCSGLHEQNRRELLARNRPFDPAAVCFTAFGDPFDVRVAGLIPAVHREAVAEGVLLHLLRRPNGSAPAAVAWALDFVSQAHAAPKAPSTLKYGLCEHLLWQGRSQEVGTLLGTDASTRAVALHGAAAVLDAEPAVPPSCTHGPSGSGSMRLEPARAAAGCGAPSSSSRDCRHRSHSCVSQRS